MVQKANLARLAALAALLGAVAFPAPAQAWWVRPAWGWRAPVVFVAPPPVFVAPPAPYYAGPPVRSAGPGAYWVRPHYNRLGAFIPGHWQ